MKLSIIIPVYNEKSTILKILEKIKNINLYVDKEIIIVDDCSTDGTTNILKNLKDKNIKIIYGKKNQGKGSSIITGLKYVTGDYVIIQDADLEYNPEEYKKLLDISIKNDLDVVYGSRFLNKKYKDFKKTQKNFIFIHYIGNKILSLITTLLYGKLITDMETCYKLIKTPIIKNLNLKAKRFDIEPEITTKLLKNKYKIKEIPITFKARDFEHGKKINWKDGLKAFYYLVKYKFIN
ncbi:MAG: glycosyltransferase family 2 protein [Nanoarchaeota archaeon]|nr:glycosyltransferase family 2 protein [Nanoarchaeota archaeon]